MRTPHARSARRRARAAAVSLLAASAVALVPAAASAATAAPGAAAGGVAAGPAYVRAAHLVPDLPRMDVSLTAQGATDATATVAGAAYGDVSPYTPVAAGPYATALRTAGAATSTSPAVSGSLLALAGRSYTVAALGTGADAQLVPLVDDLTPPAAGTARVRVLSAAPTATAVSVVAENGPTVTRDAAFASATTYADVPAGTWSLVATPTGGTATEGRTSVDLVAGRTYTLAVTAGEGGAGGAGGALSVLPVADASGPAQAPVGGAATGAGGLVTGGRADPAGTAVLGASAGAVLAGGAAALVLARRRRSAA